MSSYSGVQRRVSFSPLLHGEERCECQTGRRKTLPELPLLKIPPNELTNEPAHVSASTESCDSGMYSEEDDSSSGSREEGKKVKWLSSVVNNIFGDMFKGGNNSSEIPPTGDAHILQEYQFMMSSSFSSEPFSKDATYYCVSPACQTFGKVKNRIPSKKKYCNGRLIPFPSESSIQLATVQSSSDCTQSEQHSTVWIQLLPDILPAGNLYNQPPTLQIKHACSQSGINYRGDQSFDLSAFSEADRNRILWYRYLGRQVESDLVKSTDEEETNFLSLKLRHLSRQVCGRCGSGFSMLFNRRLQCSFCQLGVCKNCCKKLTPDGNWICDACTEKKELQRQSCEWFYDHLHKSFNDFGSAKIMKSISHNEHSSRSIDENASQVRDHIEKVVEALIGEHIDQVNINRLVNDPQYDGLFKDYHEKLSDALAGLVLAIQLVMENRTIEDENTTPTTAHIKLKNLINQLIIDAGKFKKAFMVTPETIHHSFRPQEEESSYEDLLATAIINKVVTSTRQKYHRGHFNSDNVSAASEGGTVLSSSGVVVEESCKSLCSDDGCIASSEESGRGASASPSSTPVTPLRPSSSAGEEEDTFFSGSCRQYEETMSNESGEAPWPISQGGNQFMIQEEIEEVTTTIYDDQITERIIVRKNPKIRSAASCPTLSSLDSLLLSEEGGLDYVPIMDEESKTTTVPFPELGLDASTLANAPGWEENWFFRKQSSQQPSNFVKLSALVHLLTDDPVSMLVPNPNEDCRPQIGTRDVDEISELSERNSVGSIEFSTSSEEEEEEEDLTLGSAASKATVQEKNSFQVHMSRMDVLGRPSPIGHPVEDEYPQEADVEHTETSVPAEVKPSSLFPDRGNVDFLKSPTTLGSSLTSGKILEVSCLCSRNLDVAWFRNASPIGNDGTHYEVWRRKVDALSTEHFLRIYDIRGDDAGDYRVVAYNDDGEKWHDFKVHVQEYEGQNSIPEIFCYPDDSQSEEEGLSKKFICQVKGHPEPRLVFYKDGKRLSRNENIAIEYFNDYGEWSLEIRRVSHRDVGLYEVLAENRVGSCRRSWNLSLRPKLPTSKPPPVPCCDLDAVVEEEHQETAAAATDLLEESLVESAPNKVPLQAQNNRILAEAINTSLLQDCSQNRVVQQQKEAAMMKKLEEEHGEDASTPPGSIADREHRKWVELAVNMPNNPYSKESIERRMRIGSSSLVRNSSEGGFMPKLTIEDVQEVRNDAETPSRIYCGLKSVDDSLYRRDYYINKHSEDTKKAAHSTSFQKELDFEPIDRRTRELEDSEDDKGSRVLLAAGSAPQNFAADEKRKEEELEEDVTTLKANMSELSNEFSSICSLNEMQDSGIGSSCERSSLLAGKVEAEILRFQKDIEKVNKEKSELLNWQLKKIEKRKKCPPKEIGPPRRYYSSMDSLLSITEDSSTSSPDHPTPSAFHEKGNRIISDRTIKNLNKKQVSISENSTVIISCYEDDDDRFDDSAAAAILPSVKKLVNKFMPSESESEVKPTTTTNNNLPVVKKSKNRFNNIRTSNEIHSLTARSVPRQFREGLKKGLTHFTDKNIKIPGLDTSNRYGLSEDDTYYYYEDEEDSPPNVVYDSKQQSKSNSSTLESTRTPSPEHVGIPASRVRLTPKKRSDVTTSYCYTSDESTTNEQRTVQHPPSSRRKQQIQRLAVQS